MANDDEAPQPIVCEDVANVDFPRCDGEIRVFAQGRRAMEALCRHHAFQRGYYSVPRLLPKGDATEEAYMAYRRRLQYTEELNAAFVQVFHPELVCVENTDECAKDKVAEYYFSDGGALPICTTHLEGSPALRDGEAGHWMSREYYDEVYHKLLSLPRLIFPSV